MSFYTPEFLIEKAHQISFTLSFSAINMSPPSLHYKQAALIVRARDPYRANINSVNYSERGEQFIKSLHARSKKSTYQVRISGLFALQYSIDLFVL